MKSCGLRHLGTVKAVIILGTDSQCFKYYNGELYILTYSNGDVVEAKVETCYETDNGLEEDDPNYEEYHACAMKMTNLAEGWSYSEHNGRVHIKDSNGNFRVRIAPSDNVTSYQHRHILDELGNPLDIEGNVVSPKSSDGHIPWDN